MLNGKKDGNSVLHVHIGTQVGMCVCLLDPGSLRCSIKVENVAIGDARV